MKKRAFCLLLALVILLSLGCYPADTGSSSSTLGSSTGSTSTAPTTTAPTTTSPTTTAPTQPTVTDPPVTEPPVTEPPVTQPPATEPQPTVPVDSRDPVLTPPDAEDGPCDFFDDAVFIGDSVSVMLKNENIRSGAFGDALFLPVGNYGIHNAYYTYLPISYQGQKMTIWDALAACGKKKVFIMLGMNDIALYGIDSTINHWGMLIEKILQYAPDVEFYIQSCTPIYTGGEKGKLNNENMDAYNVRLEEFAKTNGHHFVDVAPYFKDGTGGLAPIYCSDSYVHLSYTGAGVWVKVLKAFAAEYTPVAPPDDPPADPRDPVVDPPAAPEGMEGFFSDAVFVGDSVTQGLQTECMRSGALGSALFLATKSFGLYNSLNGILFHSFQGQQMTTEDAVAACGAKKVFIMLGMNDMVSVNPEPCIGKWREKIDRILEKSPDVEIYLQTVTPVYTGAESGKLTNPNIDTYNTLLQEFCENNGYHFIDVASYLKDSTGGLAGSYTSDHYVHLSTAGVQVWIQVLKNYAAQQGENNEN